MKLINLDLLERVLSICVVIFVLLHLTSCAKQLLKQAPPLKKSETFYIFEDDVGVISHNRCKKRKGKDRKCTKTYFKVNDMWNTFFPGYIIIQKSKVF